MNRTKEFYNIPETGRQLIRHFQEIGRGNIFDLATELTNSYMEVETMTSPELDYINYLKAVDLWFIVIKVLNSQRRDIRINIDNEMLKINNRMVEVKKKLLVKYKSGKLEKDFESLVDKTKLTLHEEYYLSFLSNYSDLDEVEFKELLGLEE